MLQENGGLLRQRGPDAALTDGEAFAMGRIGESLGIPSVRQICCYFKTHWSQPIFSPYSESMQLYTTTVCLGIGLLRYQ